MQVLDRYATGGIVRRADERRATVAEADRLRIATPSTEKRVRELSGGNQQKGLYAMNGGA